MAYVTEDKRVREIIDDLRSGAIDAESAAARLRDLAADPGETLPKGWARPGKALLDWEVAEAIKAATAA